MTSFWILDFGFSIARIRSAGIFVFAICDFLYSLSVSVQAQQPNAYRIGVVTGGGAFYETIDGLRSGLKQLGFEEGKQFVLAIRDTKSDVAKAAEEAARNLEQENVNLIYTTQTNVTIAARRATANIPIVFCAGSDPVVVGLVDSFANPKGRLTGVYSMTADLNRKRLEILKEIIPKLRRVVTFYNPRRATTIKAAKQAREEAQRLEVEVVERHIASIEELQAAMRALRVGEVDAIFAVPDPIVVNHDQLIIDTARVKRLPTMFLFPSQVLKGGLASYSVDLHAVGRLSAKHVQRILAGIKPADLPVERVDKISLVINLKTAKQIGLTIPPNVLARADKVIR
jgi:ABC-type uncharacterized transport system substrate-binding protein